MGAHRSRCTRSKPTWSIGEVRVRHFLHFLDSCQSANNRAIPSCIIDLTRRPNPPNPLQAFRVGLTHLAYIIFIIDCSPDRSNCAKILKNEDILKILHFELNQTREEFEETKKQTLIRPHNEMVLVVMCENRLTIRHLPGFQFLLDGLPIYQPIVAEKWAESFASLIESGDGAWKGPVSETHIDHGDFTASRKNSDQHYKRFVEASFPDVPSAGQAPESHALVKSVARK